MIPDQNLSVAMMVVCIAVLLNTALPCRASSEQEPTELEFILSCNPIESAPKAAKVRVHLSTPGVKTLLVGAIRFYQLFISTQDAPSCNFVPSCSRFGVETIKRLGVIRGILLTSDRLQRCNSVSTSRYQLDYRSGRLMDSARLYQEMLR